ncbi:MAG: 30S ribosomal protein S6 [Patescibacteria group bacterium]
MYELTYLISPLAAEVDTTAVTDKVRSLILDLKGEIKNETIGEKKRLSFLIKKQGFGFYATINFSIEPEQVAEIEKSLRFNNGILRYLIINLDELRAQKALPVRLFKTKPTATISDLSDKGEKVKIEELDKKLEELLK